MMGMMTMVRVLPDKEYEEMQARIREREIASTASNHHEQLIDERAFRRGR